jgi:excisionase family DNA binding protein
MSAQGGRSTTPRLTADAARSAVPSGFLAAPLLKAEEVAELLQVSRETVFELARRTRDPLPSVKVGRARRFVRAGVEAWLLSNASR